MTDDVDTELLRLAALAREAGGPIVAVELQWGVHDDDDGGYWLVVVCVIVARPGPTSSAYRSHGLLEVRADEPAERARARSIASRLAAHLGVELRMPPPEEASVTAGSRWIEAHAGAPPVSYPVWWDGYWWSDDGDRHDERGETTITATSGREACALVERMTAERLRADARPVFVRTGIAGMVASGWHHRAPPLLASLPSVDEIRGIHLDAPSIDSVVGQLRTRAPAATTLDLMRAVGQAFGISLEDLAPLAAWSAGRLSTHELERTVGAAIASNRSTWDRPRRLRDARARQESLAAALRADRRGGAGSIELMKNLREAFGVSLRAAKAAVDGLAAGPDAQVDAELEAAIAAVRPQ